jgi:hypothetical protein
MNMSSQYGQAYGLGYVRVGGRRPLPRHAGQGIGAGGQSMLARLGRSVTNWNHLVPNRAIWTPKWPDGPKADGSGGPLE